MLVSKLPSFTRKRFIGSLEIRCLSTPSLYTKTAIFVSVATNVPHGHAQCMFRTSNVQSVEQCLFVKCCVI